MTIWCTPCAAGDSNCLCCSAWKACGSGTGFGLAVEVDMSVSEVVRLEEVSNGTEVAEGEVAEVGAEAIRSSP